LLPVAAERSFANQHADHHPALEIGQVIHGRSFATAADVVSPSRKT
jgi:hypothetical protein